MGHALLCAFSEELSKVEVTFSRAMRYHRAIRGDFRWEAMGTNAEDKDQGSGRTASPEAA